MQVDRRRLEDLDTVVQMAAGAGTADLVGHVGAGVDLAGVGVVVRGHQRDEHLRAIEVVVDFGVGLGGTVLGGRHLTDQDRVHAQRLRVIAEGDGDALFEPLRVADEDGRLAGQHPISLRAARGGNGHSPYLDGSP